MQWPSTDHALQNLFIFRGTEYQTKDISNMLSISLFHPSGWITNPPHRPSQLWPECSGLLWCERSGKSWLLRFMEQLSLFSIWYVISKNHLKWKFVSMKGIVDWTLKKKLSFLIIGNVALGSIDYGFFVVRPNQEYIQNKIKSREFGYQTRYT